MSPAHLIHRQQAAPQLFSMVLDDILEALAVGMNQFAGHQRDPDAAVVKACIQVGQD